MHAQREGTTCMHNVRAQHEGTSQTELEVIGTGRMPHPVGGAMGVTMS